MARPSRLLWIGVVALAASTAAAKSPIRPHRPPLRPRLPPPVIHVRSEVNEIPLASLPEGTMPAVSPRPPPETLPPAPAELSLEPLLPASPRPPAGAATPLRLKPVGPGIVAGGPSPSSETHALSPILSCPSAPPGARPRAPTPFFWEALLPSSDGARLILGQGWFDHKTCRMSEGSRSELKLGPAALLDGKPLIYGARVGGELVLVMPTLLPPGAQQQPEQVGAQLTVQRGPLFWVRMRPERGGAAVFAGGLFRHTLAEWWRGFGHGPDAPVIETSTPMQVRIDLSQSLGESSPLALVTWQRPVGVSPAARGVPGGVIQGVNFSRSSLVIDDF